MTIAQKRASLATAIDSRLPATYRVRAYKPQTSKPLEGWLEINQTDVEDVTYGEVRLSVTLVIPIASSRQQFEKTQDDITVPLISAVTAAGGRAPVVTAVREQVGQSDLYSLSCTFLTESEVS